MAGLPGLFAFSEVSSVTTERRWTCANCSRHLAKLSIEAGAAVQIRQKCPKCGAYNTFDTAGVAIPDVEKALLAIA
jgi:phage FluMu protein Com